MSTRSVAPHADVAPADARAAFICQTYLHLAGAVLALIVIETVQVQAPFASVALLFWNVLRLVQRR